MNRAEQAGLELREMDELAAQDSVLHRLSPLSKLFVTVFYIAVTVSFPKYGLTRLVWMALFPVAGYQLACWAQFNGSGDFLQCNNQGFRCACAFRSCAWCCRSCARSGF